MARESHKRRRLVQNWSNDEAQEEAVRVTTPPSMRSVSASSPPLRKELTPPRRETAVSEQTPTPPPESRATPDVAGRSMETSESAASPCGGRGAATRGRGHGGWLYRSLFHRLDL